MRAGRVFWDLDFQTCDADPYLKRSIYGLSKNIEPAILLHYQQGVMVCSSGTQSWKVEAQINLKFQHPSSTVLPLSLALKF